MTEKEIIDALKVPGGSITLGVTESAPVKKKPIPVIKKGDMSPETKALPDEVVKPPKGIGKSENDMGPYRRGLEMLSKEEYEKLPKIKPSSFDLKSAPPGVDVDEQGNIEYKKKGGMVKTKKMAKGGTASSRADGCAVRGKTKA